MFHNAYLTLGSGSLAAMAVLETHYREGMSKEDAVNLVVAAIEAGVYFDLGSGSNVDVVVISKGKIEFHRNIKSDNHKMY